MAKCLVTKLSGTVNNDNLLRLGEIRIGMKPHSSPNIYNSSFMIKASKEIKLEIIGNGYFSNYGLTENRGKTMTIPANEETDVFVSNGDYQIAILGVYYITKLHFHGNSVVGTDVTQRSININDLSRAKGLESLDITAASNVSGDLSSLSTLVNLNNLILSTTNITGDFSSLKNLVKLTNLALENSKKMSGNISSFAAMTKLKALQIECSSQVYGNIDSLKNLSECKKISIRYGSLSGDMALVPAKVRIVSLIYGYNTHFTWSTRPSSSTIFGMEGSLTFKDIDAMLKGIASCQAVSDATGAEKIISVQGTRTSASDEAVATLQGKGYTISISKT